MALKKYFALSIIAASVAMSACSSDDDDDGDGDTTGGMTDTGMTDVGMTDTGMTDTGMTDTGMTDGGMPATPVTSDPMSYTPTGTSVIDTARGTDEDGDGMFEGGVPGLESLVATILPYGDLVDLLDANDGVATVFAPNNEAFAAVTRAEGDEAAIKRVLQYHVVPGSAINTGALTADQTLPLTLGTAADADLTLQDDGTGNIVVVDSDGSEVSVGDAVVVGGSVVYIIGEVLTPPAEMAPGGDEGGDMTGSGGDEGGDTPTGTTGSAFAAIAADSSLSSYSDLAVASGRFDLSLDAGNSQFVTFVPTNTAFAAITPAPTDARAFTVSSISAPGALAEDGDYVGTSSTNDGGTPDDTSDDVVSTGLTFMVTGTGEGEALMVNGMPAEYLATGGEGGTVIKYGTE